MGGKSTSFDHSAGTYVDSFFAPGLPSTTMKLARVEASDSRTARRRRSSAAIRGNPVWFPESRDVCAGGLHIDRIE